jgi:hypothetical protein
VSETYSVRSSAEKASPFGWIEVVGHDARHAGRGIDAVDVAAADLALGR